MSILDTSAHYEHTLLIPGLYPDDNKFTRSSLADAVIHMGKSTLGIKHQLLLITAFEGVSCALNLVPHTMYGDSWGSMRHILEELGIV